MREERDAYEMREERESGFCTNHLFTFLFSHVRWHSAQGSGPVPPSAPITRKPNQDSALFIFAERTGDSPSCIPSERESLFRIPNPSHALDSRELQNPLPEKKHQQKTPTGSVRGGFPWEVLPENSSNPISLLPVGDLPWEEEGDFPEGRSALPLGRFCRGSGLPWELGVLEVPGGHVKTESREVRLR